MSVRQVTLVEAGGSDIPQEVYDEVTDLWASNEFGNDNYYYTWGNEDFAAIDDPDSYDLWFGPYPKLAQWLRDNGVKDTCLIHYWW